MRLYKVVTDDGNTMMVRSDTYPFVDNYLFVQGYYYDEDKTSNKYTISGWGMINTHAIDDIIPMEDKLTDEEFMSYMDEKQKEEWLKLDCSNYCIRKYKDLQEKQMLEEYYKSMKKGKEVVDEIDDGVNYEDTI